MRDFAKISPKFWLGATGKKLRSAGIEAQIVAMYLLTCPHANMIGLYYMPEMLVAHETGLTTELAAKGLDGCVATQFCNYDRESECVWVREMARFQIGEELKESDKRCAGVQNEYNTVPDCPQLGPFFDRYAEAFCMTKSRGITSPLEAPSKPLRRGKIESGRGCLPPGSKEKEKEKEKEKDSFVADATQSTKLGTRLPEDWKLLKPWGDWVMTEFPGSTPEGIRQCAAQFADYWHSVAGAKSRKVDWLATWRNWVRNNSAKLSAVAVSQAPKPWANAI